MALQQRELPFQVLVQLWHLLLLPEHYQEVQQMLKLKVVRNKWTFPLVDYFRADCLDGNWDTMILLVLSATAGNNECGNCVRILVSKCDRH